MKRILIISLGAGVKTSVPNGKDILAISKALINTDEEIKVDILSRLDDYEEGNVRIFQIKSQIAYIQAKNDYIIRTLINNKPYLMSLIGRLILRYYRWEESRIDYADKKHLRILKRWMKEHRTKYDLIISASHPFYVHEYAQFLKRELGIKKWIAYILDIYADSYEVKDKKIAITKEQECFENCDKIFIVDRFVQTAKFSPIKSYLSKTVSIPYHLIRDKTTGTTYKHSDGCIHLVYGGSLINAIRNPRKLLEVISLMPNSIVLDLYSYGCEDIIKEYLSDKVRHHKIIENPQEYDAIIRGADVLISLGNSVENFVASKVFDYCSYGKPIIHFINCKNDYTVTALKDYPLICFIDYNDDIAIIAKKITEFIDRHRFDSLNYDCIREILSTMTVEKTVNEILQVMNDD